MELTPIQLAGASITLQVVGAEVPTAVGVVEQILVLELGESAREVVVVREPAPIDVVEVLLPGAAPSPGPGPAPAQYERRAELVDADLAYRGEAALGSAETAPAWRISRIDTGTGEPVVTWAGGAQAFDKAWDARHTYEYKELL